MEAAPLMFFILFLQLTASVPAANEEFTYNGFNITDLYLDGIASIAPNGMLMLNNNTKYMQNHAYHKTVIQFKEASNGKLSSFSTCFIFAIVSEHPDIGGHGLAFVISPTRGLPGAMPNQYLGLFNSSNNGKSSNHVLAIELDTIKNIEFGDIDNNHVGIDINSLRSVAAASASYFLEGTGGYRNLTIVSGQPLIVWVDYDGEEMKLYVTISPINVPKPSLPLLSLPTNLSRLMYDSMYIGFSSSSGSIKTSHYVLGWSFRLNGQAPALNLASLPSLPQHGKRNKSSYKVEIYVYAAAALILVAAAVITCMMVRKLRYVEFLEDWEVEYRHHRFTYRDLYKATRGFRDDELLGIGGFGQVYKGKLPTSKTEIAVKRISHDSRQGMRVFVSEIVTIGQLCHRNLVQLLGYCRRKGELFLVYEFMSNGSLDKFIFDDTGKKTLNWSQRFQIIKGVASAIYYLHEEWEKVVIHRDIKASNILLDSELNAKVGDFGLSRLYDHGSNPNTTHVVGTMGYIAPELNKTGRATTATDVYAFGAFLLEVTCARRPILEESSPDVRTLVDWVWSSWKRGVIMDCRDAKLGNDFKPEEVELVMKLGLMCSHPSPDVRPGMRQIVQILNEISAQVFTSRQQEAFSAMSYSYASGGLGDKSYHRI